MPRALLKRILPAPHTLRDRWPVRLCGARLADPKLWTLQRRGVANPFALVPLYYFAYRVGVAILQVPPHHFRFVADWKWFRYGLMPVWQPFVVGCAVCALVCGVLGWLSLEILWRWHVASRYRSRHTAADAS